MATKPKKGAKYDLKAADRKRNLAVQIGLTAVVVIFAVAVVLYIVMSGEEKPTVGDVKPIRVASENVITKDGSDEPKAVISLYEDFLCPGCRGFEQNFGPTLNKLIDSGAAAVDYHMVSILDRVGEGYSSRAGNAAYCVAEEDIEAFRRFHAALYAQQPAEGVGPYPDNARLIEIARQAGVVGGVPDCISKQKYTKMIQGQASAAGVRTTPTVRINGEEYKPTSPDDLIAKIEEIVGNVPALDSGAPPPAADPRTALPPTPQAPNVPAQTPPGPAPAAPTPKP
ncbi:thioredoxin family protein [Mycolicibacterium hassiacum DSM 44199]|uniref:Thioredoxin family protein n=2 Tax=Mycolicibacterium hassiacum TaxID=46351 RepID=K5BFZ7_MYCHD|nr:thioredoxin domain-containing protein [Mycolicibacterium hassiacum]EKF24322.1 thioredoxin family protein [Mycolicibacterium hassiacum DSM 44199]MDA4085279.1 membrane protein [Mycolicibacterium hassiacum DSM 44199]VCT89279.1 Serine/threonine-protein kinase PknE [Mycolicibacterium hassiacum DSM 44199]